MKKKLTAILLSICITAVLLPTISSADEVTEIGSLAEFNTFAGNVACGDTYAGKTVRLTTSFSLSQSWRPVGWHEGTTGILNNCKTFAGTFDGNGNTITLPDFGTGAAGHTYIALFAHNTGTIKNLCVAGGTIQQTRPSLDAYVSGIAAYNNGTVKDCRSTITVNGDSNNSNKYFSGIVALNDSQGVVEGCGFSGRSTDGGRYKAGIVAQNRGVVKNCYNNSPEFKKGYYKGGIVALNEHGATVTQCYSTGNNKEGDYNGGIASENQGTVSYCFFDGALSGLSQGSIVYNNTGTIANCYSPNIFPLVRTGNGAVNSCYYDNQTNTAANQPGTGLPTLQMTGLTALNVDNMADIGNETMWTVKANKENTDNTTLYYPQLKYFADKGHDFLSAAGYRLSFDLNGLLGNISPVMQRAGENIALSGITGVEVPGGVTFNGWNTAADGTGTGYAVGSSFNADVHSKLYAQWQGDLEAQLSSSSDRYDLSNTGSNHKTISIQLAVGNHERTLAGIYYNGTMLVNNTDYTVSDNIYTLSPDWLDARSVGTHELSFHLTRGTAAASLNLPFTLYVEDTAAHADIIETQPQSVTTAEASDLPATGNYLPPVLWLAIMLLSSAAVVGSIVYKHSRQR